ncbi:P-loop NTPase fold protein [Achromobacter xylosoxidans]
MNSPEKWNPGMDLNASRNALTQFLENGKGQVLGLSGRWGAGKTHLWLSLRDTLPAAKTALYASCFGLKSPDEIVRALLQDAASNASKYGEAGGKVMKETGKNSPTRCATSPSSARPPTHCWRPARWPNPSSPACWCASASSCWTTWNAATPRCRWRRCSAMWTRSRARAAPCC